MRHNVYVNPCRKGSIRRFEISVYFSVFRNRVPPSESLLGQFLSVGALPELGQCAFTRKGEQSVFVCRKSNLRRVSKRCIEPLERSVLTMKAIFALGIVLFVLFTVVKAQSPSVAAPADPWEPVRTSFENYALIPNGAVSVGRRGLGTVFSYVKGMPNHCLYCVSCTLNENASFYRIGLNILNFSFNLGLASIFINFVLTCVDCAGNWSLTQNTLVASASKLMASLAIWTLIQEGKMSITDRPQQYLSWWTNDTTNDPRARVTLSDLLSFTSGFSNEYDCPTQTMEECVQLIYNNGTVTEPGAVYHYAGDHLQVAGLMAIKAAGYSRWVDLWNDRVKTPTGTTGFTAWTPSTSTNSRVAGGLTTNHNTYQSLFMGFYEPSILNQTTLNMMQQDRTPASSVTIDFRPPAVPSTADWHYCGSFWYQCDLPVFNQTCADKKVFSSPGAFGFMPIVDRVNDFWIIISQFSNTAMWSVQWEVNNHASIVGVMNQLYGPPVSAPPTQSSAPTSAPTASAPVLSTPVQPSPPAAASAPQAASTPVSPKTPSSVAHTTSLPIGFAVAMVLLAFIAN
jgi:hypothetical protein